MVVQINTMITATQYQQPVFKSKRKGRMTDAATDSSNTDETARSGVTGNATAAASIGTLCSTC